MGIIHKIDEKNQNKVSGGLTYRYGVGNGRPYEVINDVNGEVIKRCQSMDEAKNYAKFIIMVQPK